MRELTFEEMEQIAGGLPVPVIVALIAAGTTALYNAEQRVFNERGAISAWWDSLDSCERVSWSLVPVVNIAIHYARLWNTVSPQIPSC